VICFFSQQGRFVQCEIYPGQPHILTVIDADGVERTESHTLDDHLQTRWNEVCVQLSRDGWSGPFGRDARI
jgi:hypothetical protein